MTLLWSAFMAVVSYYAQIPRGASMACSIGAIALIWFVLPRFENSAKGIWVVFAITGLLGFGLGPMLNAYLSTSNGTTMVAAALGGTGIIFMGLSGYALATKKDFSFMGGFLVAGFIVALLAMVANIFLKMTALAIVIDAAVIMIMSGFILWETGNIVNGGEKNYVRATISLFLSIYNIFVSLLSLMGLAGGD